MVVFSNYPDDPRVRREAEALAALGMHVDVLCLRKPGIGSTDTVNGVNVYRLPVMRKRGNPARYVWEYAAFIFLALIKLAILNFKKTYDIVHVHNMPDVLVFSAIIPRLGGAKIILDLHDPMPEVFMTKYGIGHDHLMIRMLLLCERLSIGFADLVLTPNIAFRNLFIARGCPKEKVHVVMNSPDPIIFQSHGKATSPIGVRVPNQFVLMYHGTVVERHGLDTALEALVNLRSRVSNMVFHVFGDGDFVEAFQAKVKLLGLENIVRYHGQVSLETIAAAIPSIDVGLVPNKRSVFTEINFPTRIFEYLAEGKSVVAPRTKGIGDYFDESEIEYFEPGSAKDLSDVILRIHSDRQRASGVLERGRMVYERWAWPAEKAKFVELVRTLGLSRLNSLVS